MRRNRITKLSACQLTRFSWDHPAFRLGHADSSGLLLIPSLVESKYPFQGHLDLDMHQVRYVIVYYWPPENH